MTYVAVLVAWPVLVAVYVLLIERTVQVADQRHASRYLTRIELCALADGALEPYGVIDQPMALRILTGR